MSDGRVLLWALLSLTVMLSAIIVVLLSERKVPMDCTANTEAMAVWITGCAYDPRQSTQGCIDVAEKIFCKPACQE
jgi:hypothetical protein